MARRASTKFIVIHCSATPPKRDIGAKEITHWHLQAGYLTIGYHIVIRRSGAVEMGRPMNEIGAHARGANATSIGVCLVGGTDASGKSESNYTPEQWETLETVVQSALLNYPEAQVIGHRDVPGTKKDCPCFDVKQWWAAIDSNP